MASELLKLLEAIARFRENEVRAQELVNGNASGYYGTNVSPFQKVETFPHFMGRIGREFGDQLVIFQSQGSGAINSFKKDGTIAISGFQSAGGKAIQDFSNDGNTATSGFISKGDMAIAGFNTSGEKTIFEFVNSGDTVIAEFVNAGKSVINDIFDASDSKYSGVFNQINAVGGDLDTLGLKTATAITRLTESSIRQDLEIDGLRAGFANAAGDIDGLTQTASDCVHFIWQNAVAAVRQARAAILNTNHILALM